MPHWQFSIAYANFWEEIAEVHSTHCFLRKKYNGFAIHQKYLKFRYTNIQTLGRVAIAYAITFFIFELGALGLDY